MHGPVVGSDSGETGDDAAAIGRVESPREGAGEPVVGRWWIRAQALVQGGGQRFVEMQEQALELDESSERGVAVASGYRPL